MFLFFKLLRFYMGLLVIFFLISGQVYADVINKAVEAGQQEYTRSCEICHGAKAKGNGPYASRLIIKPADLTVLSRENNGVIPITSVYRMIDGSDEVVFHGSSSMPIWGDRFRSESASELDTDNSQTLVRGRIFELLLFLDTLQVK